MTLPLSITFSSNTDSHATGDVIAAPEELINFSRAKGRGVLINSVTLIDLSDTGVSLDLIFLSASGSIGAESASFAMTDAVAATVLGLITVPGTYIDGTNNQFQVVRNVGLQIHPAQTTTSVWVGVIARGSIQPAAAGDITAIIGREFL